MERVDLSQIGNLIKEMVQTETNYRDGISALEEVVNVPIRVIIHSVFEKQKVNIVQSQLKDNVSNMSNRLFPDLVHLVQISTRFLDEIVNFNKNHQADVLAQLKKICSTFRSLRDDIAKNFSLYITQYEDSENILNADDEIKCRVSNEALLLVEQAREQSRLTISDFKYENVKIFPVQRLPRYITLLENCLNCLPESHANREDVEETLEVLKGVTEQINTENVMHKRQALLHNLSNVYNSHMVKT